MLSHVSRHQAVTSSSLIFASCKLLHLQTEAKISFFNLSYFNGWSPTTFGPKHVLGMEARNGNNCSLCCRECIHAGTCLCCAGITVCGYLEGERGGGGGGGGGVSVNDKFC